MSIRSCIILAAGFASALLAGPSLAETGWPTRPIKLVVPFVAGGAADLLARTFADRVGAALGQPMIVENIGGAGGNIASSSVVRSSPDGYTLFFASTGPAAMNSLMYKKLTYDPKKDFTPIVLVGKTPVIIAARPDAPVASIKDVIAYGKANPGKLTVGYPGSGTLGHITGVLLAQRAGIELTNVQYRGGGQLIIDLAGSHVDLAIDAVTPYVPLVQESRLRGLAVSTATRLKQLPNVPTVAEAGLPDFEASVWFCLLGPAGLPPDVVSKLNTVSNDFVRSKIAQETFEKLGVIPAGSTAADLKAFIDRELETWRPVIKAAKIEL